MDEFPIIMDEFPIITDEFPIINDEARVKKFVCFLKEKL